MDDQPDLEDVVDPADRLNRVWKFYKRLSPIEQELMRLLAWVEFVDDSRRCLWNVLKAAGVVLGLITVGKGAYDVLAPLVGN